VSTSRQSYDALICQMSDGDIVINSATTDHQSYFSCLQSMLGVIGIFSFFYNLLGSLYIYNVHYNGV